MPDQITVVGVGALGSHLIPLLRNLKAELSVIDFDRVEQKNVQSQFHSKTSVGKLKVLGLQQTMQFLFKVKLNTNSNKLIGKNAKQLLSSADLLVDCLDNAESRNIVQTYARKHKIPCVHGALAADGAYAQIAWNNDFLIDENPGEAPTCEDGEHLPFISIVSSYLAYSIQTFIGSRKTQGFQVFPGGAKRT